jgi:hypothetical protein
MADPIAFTIEPSLSVNPSLNFRLWRTKLIREVAAMMPDVYGIHGLLFLIMDPATYADLPGAMRPSDISLKRPEWDPDFTPQELKKYLLDKEAVDTLMKCNSAIRSAILKSIGPAICEEIIDPRYDYVTISASEILAFLDARFPLEGPGVLQLLRADLQKAAPGSEPTTFALHATTFKGTVRHLAQAGQIYPQEWLIDQFIQTCTAQPPLMEAIGDYIKATSTQRKQLLRSVASLVTFVQTRLEEPLFGTVLAAQRFAGATSQLASDDSYLTDLIATSISSAMAAAYQRQPPPASGASNRAPTASAPKSYCYHHGPCGHSGAECQHMSANPTQFTAAMKSAKHPSDVPRGVTWGKAKQPTRK